MFPPNRPPMAAPAPNATGMANPPAAAGMPPQGAGGAPEPQQSGLRQVADIGFNQDVQNILFSRIQTLNPQEIKVLDAVLTPQTIPVLAKLFPELKPVFDSMGQPQGGGPIGQQPPAQAAQGAPDQAGAQGPQGPADAEDDPNQGGDSGSDEEEETDNPLAKNQASSGLLG